MYVQTTILQVKPECVPQALALLNNDLYKEFCTSIKGICQVIVLESAEEPGRLVALSFWDSMANAQEAIFDPRYAAWMAELRDWLIVSPERTGYRLLAELPLLSHPGFSFRAL